MSSGGSQWSDSTKDFGLYGVGRLLSLCIQRCAGEGGEDDRQVVMMLAGYCQYRCSQLVPSVAFTSLPASQ